VIISVILRKKKKNTFSEKKEKEYIHLYAGSEPRRCSSKGEDCLPACPME